MLNRQKAPEIKPISALVLPSPAVHQLDNGILLYEIHGGTQDVLKLEIIFAAGRPFEKKQLAARATARLLSEGSHQHTGKQIAEKLDFYGGTLQTPVNLDTSNIILYCLSKHFDKLLPLVTELLCEPAFPERELNTFVKQNKQRLQIDLSKNDVLAYRNITEQIFGDTHPYGYNSIPPTYDALTRADLITHFKINYHAAGCTIFVSGKTRPAHIQLVNQHLGRQLPMGTLTQLQLPVIRQKPQHTKFTTPETVQTALRIGRRLFNRQHPDYMGMYVLNTILGGYFGSRLMANIREDKGYTYNIFSSLDTMHYDGCFYVGTEVGNGFVTDSLHQVYNEFAVLQQDLVGEKELEMVRNYLLGNLLTMLDGAFNVADIFKAIVIEQLPPDHFDQLVDCIRHISAEKLRELAQQYLKAEDMWQVVVGE